MALVARAERVGRLAGGVWVVAELCIRLFPPAHALEPEAIVWHYVEWCAHLLAWLFAYTLFALALARTIAYVAC